jgi:phosphoglycerate kinase
MLKSKLTIDKIASQLKNKNILIRVDFNVPMKAGKIKDDTRIKESLKTIQFAMENGANCVSLMTHLGRPNGEKNLEYSVKPLIPLLSKYLNKEVEFVPDCVGQETIKV